MRTKWVMIAVIAAETLAAPPALACEDNEGPATDVYVAMFCVAFIVLVVAVVLINLIHKWVRRIVAQIIGAPHLVLL